MTLTSTEQPEALRLADALRDGEYSLYQDRAATEAELRRLHARVQELETGLKKANAQAEHFELEWYLRGDELEAAQAQRAPLTDEQIADLQDKYVGGPCPSYPLDASDWINFARAIERAHGIGKGKA